MLTNFLHRPTDNLPDVATLPKAVETQIVDLKDGDTYEMSAGFVKKEIGNHEYTMFAYNGSIPGSVLRVPQGNGAYALNANFSMSGPWKISTSMTLPVGQTLSKNFTVNVR